jgi:PTS system N-acetylglucosamine-specific IIC component
VYYGMFRYAIVRFDLKTLGREPEATRAAARALGDAAPMPEPVAARGASYLAALGGASNVLEVDACATRLRLSVVDSARLDEAALKQLGARAVLRLAAGSAQVIVGPLADQVAGEIQDAMRGQAPPSSSLGA